MSKIMSRLITIVALGGIAMSSTGCAAVVAGYLIGDGISRSKHHEDCEKNLQTTNAARVAKGLDAYPDTCGS